MAQVKAAIQDAQGNYSRFDLICLPEYFSLGLRKRLGRKTARRVARHSLDALERWARDCRSYLVGGTVPEIHGDRLYNTAFLLDRRGHVISMMDDRPGYQVAHIDLIALREWRETFRIFEFELDHTHTYT